MIKIQISFYDISLLTVILICISLILLLLLFGLIISMTNPKPIPFPFTKKEMEQNIRCKHTNRATIWGRPITLCSACHGRLGFHHDYCFDCCSRLHKNLSCNWFYKSKL